MGFGYCRTLSVLILSFCAASAQTSKNVTPSSPMSSSAIKSIVDSAAAEFLKNDPQAVGVSIGVLTEGSSYTYNYGSEDKGAKTAPAADNLYPIASITKTFTGTLLAQAATEKRLSLKDDVRKYLAEPYPNLAGESSFRAAIQFARHSREPPALPTRFASRPAAN